MNGDNPCDGRGEGPVPEGARTESGRRRFGYDRGRFVVPYEFDCPLPCEITDGLVVDK